MTHPYRYLISADNADGLIDDLCIWHDRMVAHVRRHGASPPSCACSDEDTCPRQQAAPLWAQARAAFGDGSAALTFLRQHAECARRG